MIQVGCQWWLALAWLSVALAAASVASLPRLATAIGPGTAGRLAAAIGAAEVDCI